MTLTITVQTHYGQEYPGQSHQVEEALAAIGFIRNGSTAQPAPLPMPAASVSSGLSAANNYNAALTAGVNAANETPASVLDEPSVKAIRERGKPAPGKKRRTAEEVAEDEAADKTDAGPAAPEQTDLETATAETAPQISSGENRVGPEDETEEDQIQDIADEHAEAAPVDKAAMTLEDVRSVVGDYVTTFGMPAVQADGAKILESVLGPVPADLKDTKGNPTKVWPLAKIPDDRCGDVVAAFRKALQDNPFGQERVS